MSRQHTIHEIRTVEEADLEMLSESLGRTFYNYPSMRWMFPDEDARYSQCRQALKATLRLRLGSKSAFTTQRLEGAATWDPPGRLESTAEEKKWYIPTMMALLGERVSMVSSGFALLGKHRPQQPHWYLANMGVDPDHKRTGVGTSLLMHVLDRCDDAGDPAHLETSDPVANIPYYERFGFEVISEVQVPGGPLFAIMTRQPR
jgi:GNAT superfamily N-acetyltransferase